MRVTANECRRFRFVIGIAINQLIKFYHTPKPMYRRTPTNGKQVKGPFRILAIALLT